MMDWVKFFQDVGDEPIQLLFRDYMTHGAFTVEDLYQAFKARLKDENSKVLEEK